MLTTEVLLRNTHAYAPKVAQRGHYSDLKGRIILQDSMFAPGAGKKRRHLYLQAGLSNDDSTGLYHPCVIRMNGSRSDPNQYLLRLDSLLWVHCRCAYFTYNCEEALKRARASSILDCVPSRNKYIRNPNMIPHLCKHLYASITSTLKIEENKTKYDDSKRTGIIYKDLQSADKSQRSRKDRTS